MTENNTRGNNKAIDGEWYENRITNSVSGWKFFVRIMFLMTVSAFAIFVAAEWKWTNGDTMSFSILAILGSTFIVLAIPSTHYFGQYIFSDYSFFQPFQGGIRFVILQAISWTFYSITAIIVVLSIAYAEHTDGLLMSGGVIGVLSQVFMVSSLLTFDHTSSACGRKRSPSSPKRLLRANNILHNERNWKQFSHEYIAMNTTLVIIALFLAFISEHSHDVSYRSGFVTLSLVCCAAAISLTRGLGKPTSRHDSHESFWEILSAEGFGWIMFGISISIQGAFLFSMIYVGTHHHYSFEGMIYIGVLAAIVAQYIIVRSLRKFRASTKSKVNPFTYRKLPVQSLSSWFRMHCLLTFFSNTQFVSFASYMLLLSIPYIIPETLQEYMDYYSWGTIPKLDGENHDFSHTFSTWFMLLVTISAWTLTFAAIKTFGAHGWRLNISLSTSSVAAFGMFLSYYMESPHYPMLFVIVSANFVYISTTYTREPEVNGYREWPAFRNAKWIFDTVAEYFGLTILLTPDMEAIAHRIGNSEDEETHYRQLILLLHPHGITPISHGYVSNTSLWRSTFPHLHVTPLVATIMHYVPFMRDIFQWAGLCDVSRAAISNLLNASKSIQIVCGGQTEMFESRSWDTEISLVRKKRKGIFKIAIQHGIGLVPIFSFGENQLFDNVYMPKIQTWFKNHLGFPFPFVMLGKYGLPIPRRVPITLVMGAPIFPKSENPDPSIEEVNELHARYFSALEALFERYKGQCGHKNFKIKWID